MSLLKGVLGDYDKLLEAEIPAPPEWLSAYLYTLFRPRLALFLSQWGPVEYTVTSGYRDPAKNEAVGGVSNSAHMQGVAADVVFTNLPAGETKRDIVAAWKTETGGYALDEGSHVHFNLPRSWGWKVIRMLAVAAVLALVLLIIILIEAL